MLAAFRFKIVSELLQSVSLEITMQSFMFGTDQVQISSNKEIATENSLSSPNSSLDEDLKMQRNYDNDITIEEAPFTKEAWEIAKK